MYQVKFTDEQGKQQVFVVNDSQMWLTRENFSGMGKFKKLKIKKLEESNEWDPFYRSLKLTQSENISRGPFQFLKVGICRS